MEGKMSMILKIGWEAELKAKNPGGHDKNCNKLHCDCMTGARINARIKRINEMIAAGEAQYEAEAI